MDACHARPAVGARLSRLGPYIYLAIPIAYLGVFVFWPLGKEIWLSFTNTSLATPNHGSFTGLQNYRQLLADPQFYLTLRVTLIYTLATVVFACGLGMAAALAIDRPFPGRWLIRGILLFGWAIPNVAATLIWMWMYNGESGILNSVLLGLGLNRVPWLTSPRWALISVIVVSVWQAAPFVMLVLLAALQSVPDEVREAARVDGADRLNIFRHVTLPHILPALQLVAVLMAVWSIRRFDIVYLLTGGGPIGSTSTLVVQLRNVAFEGYALGLASAYGVVGLILAALVAVIHFLFEQHRLRVIR